MTRFFSAFVFLVALIAFSPVYSQTLDDVINKHIEAMGGAENLSKLKSIKVETTTQLMGMELSTVTTIVQQRAFRSETTVQGLSIIQVINGNSGWSINPMAGQTEATPLPEELVKSMSGQIDMTGMFNYKSKGYKLELKGDSTLKGAPVYVVKLLMSNGSENNLFLSKDTYYPLLVTSRSVVNGQSIETRLEQSNFKKVDGILYPFSSEITAPGMPQAIPMTVKSITINPTVDETLFEMPKK